MVGSRPANSTKSHSERLYALSPVFRVVSMFNIPATGKPVILRAGTATGAAGVQVGDTLSVDLSDIMDADGLPAPSDFAYQWIRTASGTATDIPAATGANYQVAPADLGATLQVRVSFTDGTGTGESLISDAVAVLLAAAVSGPAAGTVNGPFAVTFTFSGAVSAFHYDGFRVTHGTLSALTATARVGEYTATVTPAADFEGVMTVRVLPGAVEEAGGTVNPEASNTLAVVVDRTPPEVLVAPAPGHGATPARGPFEVAIRFSEAVTGFTLDDLQVGNGGASALAAAGEAGAYTALVTPPEAFVGAVTVEVPAGAAADLAGNPSRAAPQYVRAVDQSPPTRVALALNPERLWEGGGAATVTVTARLDGSWPVDTAIALAVAGSGAADAVDFEAVADFELTVPARMTSAAAQFTLTPQDDLIDESDETVTVSGTVPDAPAMEVLAATLLLSDEEAPTRRVRLSLSLSELSEGSGATEVTVTATLDGDVLPADTEVTVTVSGSGVRRGWWASRRCSRSWSASRRGTAAAPRSSP